jgi:DNA-binding NarL/FixJ family response regulator
VSPLLLSIVEIGGYPNFSSLYQQKGFEIEQADSMRKATKLLKKIQPAVVVAEFNFQSDFRDRTSSLETLMATVQRMPDCKVIVFYEKEQRPQLERLLAVFDVFETIPFPIGEAALSTALDNVLEQVA